MKNSNMFLIGSVVLILMAIALVAILDKTSPTNNANDVRARAGTQAALSLLGVVSSVDASKGTLLVDSMQFTDTSRAGEAQNLGSMVVTAPAGFNMASVTPGMRVTIGVDAQTFNVARQTVTALTIVPLK